MGFLRFIFSSFWIWLEFVILVYVIGAGVTGLVSACRCNRKITGYRIDERWHIKIEGVSAEDVQQVIRLGVLRDMERAGEKK